MVVYSHGAPANMGTINISRQGGGGAGPALLQSCLIQQISYNREVAVQPEPTLSGNLYISCFGDKATQYSVSGIAFDVEPCQPGQGDPVAHIVEFYNDFRLNTENGTDVAQQIVLTTYNTIIGSSVVYVGILIGMQLYTTMSADGTRRHNFTFNFIALA